MLDTKEVGGRIARQIVENPEVLGDVDEVTAMSAALMLAISAGRPDVSFSKALRELANVDASHRAEAPLISDCHAVTRSAREVMTEAASYQPGGELVLWANLNSYRWLIS